MRTASGGAGLASTGFAAPAASTSRAAPAHARWVASSSHAATAIASRAMISSRFTRIAAILPVAFAVGARAYERVHGAILGPAGEPVVGAFVTFSRGDPAHRVTGLTDERGRFATPALTAPGPTLVAVRRIGWKDLRQSDVTLQDGQWLGLSLE